MERTWCICNGKEYCSGKCQQKLLLSCMQRVWFKGKRSGVECLGISLAIVNAVRLGYCLLSISLSDFVLSYEELTLTSRTGEPGAKPVQVATSWLARENFLAVLLPLSGFQITFLSRECAAVPSQARYEQFGAINESRRWRLLNWIVR